MTPRDSRGEALGICRRPSRRFTRDEAAIEEESRQGGDRALVFAPGPGHATGKRVHEA